MKRVCFYCLLTLLLTTGFQGCGGIPKGALSMTEVTLEDRRLQTRLYDTSDEPKILSAAASVLQDLGFNLDESETELGLLVASKDREAVEAGQVALSIFVAVMIGEPVPYDTKQKIRTCVVTAPAGETRGRTAVRVTFQRIVWNSEGQVSRLEKLHEPEMYQGFFDKLSKAVFLEAHGI
jgi:hypothetical protein